MFSSRSQLQKRTPENGTDRESFLSLLVDEYLHSSSYDAKSQVIANLANFAYDPINYEFIRNVGVLDVFIHVLKNESDPQLLHFAVAGVCNLCIDPLNAEYIKTHCGFKPLVDLLKINNIEVQADAITSLIYLKDYLRPEIGIEEVTKHISDIKECTDRRLANLATIFLQDVCSTNDKQ